MIGLRSKLRFLPFLSALLCVVSCAGGMSFGKRAEVPEDKIAALAEQIEEVVLNTRLDEPAASDYSVDEQTGEVVGDLEPMSLIITTDEIRREVPALADLHADTEIMLAAIRGRVMRRQAVQEFEQEGCLGENQQGLLQNIKSDLCVGDRHLKDRAAYIVLVENRDRRTIYEQVVEAVGLGRSDVNRVGEIFAKQIYKKAWAGTPLQMPDGSWERR